MGEIAVVHASQLLTLRGPSWPRVGPAMSGLGIVSDGALICRGGLIDWVGSTDQMPPFDGEVIDATGCCVLPGFVDAHTHAVFGGTRSAEFEMRCKGATYQQIAAEGGGIQSTVKATQDLNVNELADLGAQHLKWMIQGGTTAVEIKSGYGLSLQGELKLLRAAKAAANLAGVTGVRTYLGAHSIPQGQDRDAYVSDVIQVFLPAVAEARLAKYFDSFCEPGYFSVNECRQFMSSARSLGFELRIHADQFSNSGGAGLAAELRAVTADHLEYTDSYGIEALRMAGTMPVLLPGSVYALGLNHYPPAREMIDAGLPVVLATDFNPGSSPTPSIPMVMSLACTQMRMTPAECVVATTANAAHSLGLGATHGSLEVGKRADFAIHDCPDYRELAHFFGFNRASHVSSGGVRIGGTSCQSVPSVTT